MRVNGMETQEGVGPHHAPGAEVLDAPVACVSLVDVREHPLMTARQLDLLGELSALIVS